EHKLPRMVIEVFKGYYERLVSGAKGKLGESDISPISEDEIEDLAGLEKFAPAGRKALDKAAIIKLNGGLGTSMGMEKAKSLLPVKQGLTFLDIIIRQVERLREKSEKPVPLILMNSFRTHEDTMECVRGFDNKAAGLPLTFLQHKYPKVLQSDLSPAMWPNDQELEWNPPGHGDLYAALASSGLLQKMLEKGFEYAFVSNSDNLGAVLDEGILGFCMEKKPPFVMEVASRTAADKKGGHLARLKDGRLTLREVAQCPDEEIDAFQDVERYRFFNTNSLWVNLKALKQAGVLHLDMIINPKTLDPRDGESPPVYQVESAMGSAISAFDGATAVKVPRTRFAPVKKCDDLLAVMSDCFVLTPDFEVIPNPKRTLGPINIQLDSKYYKKIDDFLARFGSHLPSLANCASLTVEGDVLFQEDVELAGEVVIKNKDKEQAILTRKTLSALMK
ncbi:MAG: UTP--glucose-1-phosphate uridylyltransferase, partial [Thermodesulfobacteriota bacterium]|nr:UTP--glucose-1-phosphate uridylyltransferase [Thermodesulfobacteriota bacterium]